MFAYRPSRFRSPLPWLGLGLLLLLALSTGCASGGGATASGPKMRGLNKNEARDLITKRQAALKEAEKADLEALDPAKLESHGDSLAMRGDWMAALFQYNRALSLAAKKDKYRLRTKMAEACLRDRQFVQAGVIFKELSKKKPQDAEQHQGMGLAYLGQGLDQEALASLLKAVEMDPSLWRAHSGLGILYNKDRQPKKAIASFLAATKLQPNAPSLFNNLGMSYFIAGDLKRAEKAFTRAVRLNPNFKLAHNNLGMVMMRQGRLREAQEHFETATSRSQALNNIGVLLAWQGKTKKAAEQFKEAIDSMPRFYPKANRHLEQLKLAAPEVRNSPILDISNIILPVSGQTHYQEPATPAFQPSQSAPPNNLGHIGQDLAVGPKGLGAKQNEADLVKSALMRQNALLDSGQSHPGGLGQRVAVSPGAQAGKGYAAQAMQRGQVQGAPISRSQEAGILRSAAVNRPDGVNDPVSRQTAGGGDHRLSGRAAAESAGLRFDVRPASAVNGAVHAPSGNQAAIGGVNNGRGVGRGDVAFGQSEAGFANSQLSHNSASLLGSPGGQKEKPSLILHASGQVSGQVSGAKEKIQAARSSDGAAGVLVKGKAHEGTSSPVWRGSLALDETDGQAGKDASVGGHAAASGKRNLIAAQRPSGGVQGAEKDIAGVVSQNSTQVFGVLGQKPLNGLH
jgi:Flp pilus assembly protein TadD